MAALKTKGLALGHRIGVTSIVHPVNRRRLRNVHQTFLPIHRDLHSVWLKEHRQDLITRIIESQSQPDISKQKCGVRLACSASSDLYWSSSFHRCWKASISKSEDAMLFAEGSMESEANGQCRTWLLQVGELGPDTSHCLLGMRSLLMSERA